MTHDERAAAARVGLLNDLGRFGAAAEEAARALAADPGNHRVLAELAKALWGLGQTERATRAVQDALALDPAFPYGWYVLSFLSRAGGRVDDAVEAAREAVRRAPANALYLGQLARCLAQTAGGHEEAVRLAERALDLAPDSVEPHLAMADVMVPPPPRARLARDRLVTARRHLEAAVAIDPHNVVALSNLARAQAMLGNPIRAIGSHVGALRMAPAGFDFRALDQLFGLLLGWLGLSYLLAVVALVVPQPRGVPVMSNGFQGPRWGPWLVTASAVVVGVWLSAMLRRHLRPDAWRHVQGFLRRSPRHRRLLPALLGAWALVLASTVVPQRWQFPVFAASAVLLLGTVVTASRTARRTRSRQS